MIWKSKHLTIALTLHKYKVEIAYTIYTVWITHVETWWREILPIKGRNSGFLYLYIFKTQVIFTIILYVNIPLIQLSVTLLPIRLKLLYFTLFQLKIWSESFIFELISNSLIIYYNMSVIHHFDSLLNHHLCLMKLIYVK